MSTSQTRIGSGVTSSGLSVSGGSSIVVDKGGYLISSTINSRGA